jgi:hypothetical protein
MAEILSTEAVERPVNDLDAERIRKMRALDALQNGASWNSALEILRTDFVPSLEWSNQSITATID